MGRIQAHICRREPHPVPAEFIDGIQEIDAVVAACAGKFHEQREFCFVRIAAVAEHKKRPSEIPFFLMAVPSPVRIRVRIMPGAFFMARALPGILAGFVPASVRAGVDGHSRAIARNRKPFYRDQAVLEGGEDSGKEEQILEPAFRVISDGLAGKDFVHKVLCGISSRPGIGQFSVCANLFLWLPAIFTRRIKVQRHEFSASGRIQVP